MKHRPLQTTHGAHLSRPLPIAVNCVDTSAATCGHRRSNFAVEHHLQCGGRGEPPVVPTSQYPTSCFADSGSAPARPVPQRALAVRRAGVWLALILVAGCNTPQIPLPPPLIDMLTLGVVDDTQRIVHVEGPARSVPGHAGVFIYAQRPPDGSWKGVHGVIVAADADGSFVTDPFSATEGQPFTYRYRVDDHESRPACFLVSYANGGEVRGCK